MATLASVGLALARDVREAWGKPLAPRINEVQGFSVFLSGQGSDLRSPGSPEVKLISRVAPYSPYARARSRRPCVEIPRGSLTYSNRLRARLGLHRAQRAALLYESACLVFFLS